MGGVSKELKKTIYQSEFSISTLGSLKAMNLKKSNCNCKYTGSTT